MITFWSFSSFVRRVMMYIIIFHYDEQHHYFNKNTIQLRFSKWHIDTGALNREEMKIRKKMLIRLLQIDLLSSFYSRLQRQIQFTERWGLLYSHTHTHKSVRHTNILCIEFCLRQHRSIWCHTSTYTLNPRK